MYIYNDQLYDTDWLHTGIGILL